MIVIDGLSYLTASEAAEYIGVPAATLRSWLRCKVFKKAYKDTRWLIPLFELEMFNKGLISTSGIYKKQPEFVEEKEIQMAGRNEPYLVEDCVVIATTEKAILVVSDEIDETWVPKSLIDRDISDIDKSSTEGDRGDLVVPVWFAKENDIY